MTEVRLVGLQEALDNRPEMRDEFASRLPPLTRSARFHATEERQTFFAEIDKAASWIRHEFPLPLPWDWQALSVRGEMVLLYIAVNHGDRGIGRARFKLRKA